MDREEDIHSLIVNSIQTLSVTNKSKCNKEESALRNKEYGVRSDDKLTSNSPLNVLNDRIKDVEDFRDRFTALKPKSTKVEKVKTVKEMAQALLEEIPLEISGCQSWVQYHLVYGRILNICIDYDPVCETHLSMALKLDPALHEAWYELGECLAKKQDWSGSVDAFENALKGSRTVKYLCGLAVALRQLTTEISDYKSKLILYEYSRDVCIEAVKLDAKNDLAWHILGNSHLTIFFLKGQFENNSLKSAIKAYAKALKHSANTNFADIHLNYATALKFDQRYDLCIEQLKMAVSCCDGSSEALERLESLYLFLYAVDRAIKSKGSVSGKRLREYCKSLNVEDISAYHFDFCKKREPKHVNFNELLFGGNNGVVISGKIVGIIRNRDVIPFTFIACDKVGDSLAFTVYNCSDAFGVVLGDSICIADPYVIEVNTDIEINREEEKAPKNALDAVHVIFRAIRVMHPAFLLKNGKQVKSKFGSLCSAQALCA